MTTSSCLSSINLEEIWNQFVRNQQIPYESSIFNIAPLKMEIDARKNRRIVLEQQALFEMQALNYNLIAASNQVVKDISTLIDDDMYVAVVEKDGFTLLTYNLAEGVQWPGMLLNNDKLLKARQTKILLSLKNHIDNENCPEGFYYSICFTIFDNENKQVGALAVGSFSRPLPYELAVSVYLGAHLIEMRYNHLQMLNNYSKHLLDKLPECALLINENGYIENANKTLLNIIGHNNTNLIIGKHFNSIMSTNNSNHDSTIHSLVEIDANLNLIIKDNSVPFTLINKSTIPKPFDTHEYLLIFRKDEKCINSNKTRLFTENLSAGRDCFDRLVGHTSQLEDIKVLGKKIANLPFSILIEGESGTGKELLAEAIHLESQRKGPFVPINCGAIPKELLQSELFGYEEGTFTGGKKGGNIGKLEIADGGTLFLDEIGEMPSDMQVSLLRFLQDKIVSRMGGFTMKKVDVRIIAATNRNLMDEIKNNNFRQDLYYRLNAVNIKIPPLRKRKEDIPLLVAHFLKNICQEINIAVPETDESVINILSNYDWPGNCRELHNVMQSALAYSSGDKITLETMKPFFNPINNNVSEGTTLQDIEKQTIISRLLECEGNISRTAKSLNINRSTLYRKIKEYKGVPGT